jgi:hypothetical protein
VTNHRLGLLAIVLTLSACGSGSPTTANYTASCATALPGSAAAAPPDLPTNSAVGRATLIYSACPQCGAWLVTEDGALYNVAPLRRTPIADLPNPGPTAGTSAVVMGPVAPPEPMWGLRLSPDGRWLAQPGDGEVLIRDLTSTTVRRVAPTVNNTAWSDDGRLIVLSANGSGSDRELLDLETGQRQQVRLGQAYRWWRVAAVLGQHELLLEQSYNMESPDPDPRRETFVVTDPATGAVLREHTVDFGQDMPGGQDVPGRGAVGGRLIVRVTTMSKTDPGAVLIADLTAGRVIARYPLPMETPAGYGFWHAGRVAGDGVLLIRDYSFGGAPSAFDPIQIFSLNVSTGERRLTCTLPPHSQLILRW